MMPIATRLVSVCRRPAVWIPAAVLAAATVVFWCTDLDQAIVRLFYSGDPSRGRSLRPISPSDRPAVEDALRLGSVSGMDSRRRRAGRVDREFLLDEAERLARPGLVFCLAADRWARDFGELGVQAVLVPSSPARHRCVRRSARVSARLAIRLRRRRLLISQRARRDRVST